MKPPGDLTELREPALTRWSDRVARCFAEVANRYELSGNVLIHSDERTLDFTAPDWNAFPIRVAGCLSRTGALELLDWRTEAGDEGRRRLQEEYAEWRVIRDPEERITSFEMTTELPDYWRVLAAYEPDRTMELVSVFCGERVPASSVYGQLDPLASDVSPEEREAAFTATFFPAQGGNPYNDGRRAICCMVHPTNTLEALVALVISSATAYSVHDVAAKRYRAATAPEVIPLIPGAAQADRNSDPLVVERVGRLALEGRLVAFDDPIGVYIQGVEHSRLRQPNGSPVPVEWFEFDRGTAPSASSDGRSRYQRLKFEVPPSEGLDVSDLMDVATEQPIQFGGQLADLIQLALFLRASPSGVIDRPAQEISPDKPAGSWCEQVQAHFEEFQRVAQRPPESGRQ